jgi:TATA-box binding protein (TBP) (component of TFIID and TFIIIB)
MRQKSIKSRNDLNLPSAFIGIDVNIDSRRPLALAFRSGPEIVTGTVEEIQCSKVPSTAH